MKLIGFTGKKGSGKTEASDVAGLSFGYANIAFADPLREICQTAFGLSLLEMSDRTLKESALSRWPYKSPRELLQQVGTEMFRNSFPDVWIECFKRKVEVLHKASARGVVISDVRFLNEARAIKCLGGTVIRIVRPGLPNTDSHVSEQEMDQIQPDHTIVNDGDLVGFRNTVRQLLHQI